MMPKAAVLAVVFVGLPILGPERSLAFTGSTHPGIIDAAIESVCKMKGREHWCDILKAHQEMLRGGARLEDGFKEGKVDSSIPGLSLPDEDAASSQLETYCLHRPFCTHYWFGDKECLNQPSFGTTAMGSTDCKRPAVGEGTQWEPAFIRAVKLFNRADEHYCQYSRTNDVHEQFKAFVWLGRTAHLLADMGVPGHVISHKLKSKLEVEHRCYELSATSVVPSPSSVSSPSNPPKKPCQKPVKPVDNMLYQLFDPIRKQSMSMAYCREKGNCASRPDQNESAALQGAFAETVYEDDTLRNMTIETCQGIYATEKGNELQARAAIMLNKSVVPQTARLLQMFMVHEGIPPDKP